MEINKTKIDLELIRTNFCRPEIEIVIPKNCRGVSLGRGKKGIIIVIKNIMGYNLKSLDKKCRIEIRLSPANATGIAR
jgi:hypothetical protein